MLYTSSIDYIIFRSSIYCKFHSLSIYISMKPRDTQQMQVERNGARSRIRRIPSINSRGAWKSCKFDKRRGVRAHALAHAGQSRRLGHPVHSQKLMLKSGRIKRRWTTIDPPVSSLVVLPDIRCAESRQCMRRDYTYGRATCSPLGQGGSQSRPAECEGRGGPKRGSRNLGSCDIRSRGSGHKKKKEYQSDIRGGSIRNELSS